MLKIHLRLKTEYTQLLFFLDKKPLVRLAFCRSSLIFAQTKNRKTL